MNISQKIIVFFLPICFLGAGLRASKNQMRKDNDQMRKDIGDEELWKRFVEYQRSLEKSPVSNDEILLGGGGTGVTDAFVCPHGMDPKKFLEQRDREKQNQESGRVFYESPIKNLIDVNIPLWKQLMFKKSKEKQKILDYLKTIGVDNNFLEIESQRAKDEEVNVLKKNWNYEEPPSNIPVYYIDDVITRDRRPPVDQKQEGSDEELELTSYYLPLPTEVKKEKRQCKIKKKDGDDEQPWYSHAFERIKKVFNFNSSTEFSPVPGKDDGI